MICKIEDMNLCEKAVYFSKVKATYIAINLDYANG